MTINGEELRIPARLFRDQGKWCIAPLARPTMVLRFSTVSEAKRMARGLRWQLR